MFLLHLEDTTAVSDVGDPTDPSYSPIYLELDSTDVEPSPSPWVRCYLSLPAGNVSIQHEDGSGGAVIRFEGTTAGKWDLTHENPSLISEPEISNEITLDVLNNIPTSFWIRARTNYSETPVDDRSVALRISGQTEEV